MDFNYSPEEEEFRQEVREWLAENMKELPEWWGRRDMPGPAIDSEEYHQFHLLDLDRLEHLVRRYHRYRLFHLVNPELPVGLAVPVHPGPPAGLDRLAGPGGR